MAGRFTPENSLRQIGKLMRPFAHLSALSEITKTANILAQTQLPSLQTLQESAAFTSSVSALQTITAHSLLSDRITASVSKFDVTAFSAIESYTFAIPSVCEIAKLSLLDSFKAQAVTFPAYKMPKLPSLTDTFLYPTDTEKEKIQPLAILRKQPEPIMGEAAKMVERAKARFDQLEKENEYNPNIIVALVARLSDGTKINVQHAKNVDDRTIQIDGMDLNTKAETSVISGTEAVSLEVFTVNIGSKKPKLSVVEDNPKDE